MVRGGLLGRKNRQRLFEYIKKRERIALDK
jgi:hypothetical protein